MSHELTALIIEQGLHVFEVAGCIQEGTPETTPSTTKKKTSFLAL
jgi:hypothetical protein